MAAQWPHVKAWVVATIPTLPGLSNVTVYAGPMNTMDDPMQYVTVGYVSDDKGGNYHLMQNPDGFQWDEAGEVRCEIVAQGGDDDPTVFEGQAFAIADALDKVIRADHTLGKTLSPAGTAESTVEILSESNADGRGTGLVWTLHYTTTTL